MRIEFVAADPAGNITLLIKSPVPREDYGRIARKLLSLTEFKGEQVGFFTSPREGGRFRLEMMGGEFCGNAAMSLAAFFAYQDGLADGESAEYPLEISGADHIVPCRITREGASWIGSVHMPLPEKIEKYELEPYIRLPVVFFPGIAHAVVHEDMLSREQAERKIRSWCEAAGTDAFGILRTAPGNDRISPLVYVRETGSAVWERGCGSGSAAVGAYTAAQRAQNTALDLRQPGGLIRVNVDYDDSVRRIEISGTVKIVAMGQAWV